MSGAVQAAAVAAVAVVCCEQGVRELVCRRRARGMRRRLRHLLQAAAPARTPTLTPTSTPTLTPTSTLTSVSVSGGRPSKGLSGLPRWAGFGVAPLGAAGLGWVLFGVFGGLVAAALV
ncbi:hypothetical protein ACFVBQ_21240, partial [Streptomyces sp. NPDC057675]